MTDTSIEKGIQWHRLQPVDAWFFRDSRPSNSGENQTDLQSLFPPNHDTVIGAIRAALARQLGWVGGNWKTEITDVLGDGFNDLAPMSFVGPFLEIDKAPHAGSQEHEHELLFPMPRHILGIVTPPDNRQPFPTFTPAEERVQPSPAKIVTDRGKIHLPTFPEHKQPTGVAPDAARLTQGEGFFVTTTGMNLILSGKPPESEHCFHASRLFVHEARVGIGRNEETRTTGEGAVYSPHYVRLRKGVSLVVGVGGLDSSDDRLKLPGVFPLGGESRLAGCEAICEPTLPKSQQGNVLILATPARFESSKDEPNQNWIGAGPGEDAVLLSNQLAEYSVTTCAVDRPVRVGGADSREKDAFKSRPLVPHVAAGTVWWTDKPMSRQDGDGKLYLGQQNDHGLGLAFVGK